MVALRVSDDQVVIECQGKYNEHPKGWELTIILFCKAMNWELQHRRYDVSKDYEDNNPQQKTLDWWEDQAQYLPIIFHVAPAVYRKQLQEKYSPTAKIWLFQQYNTSFSNQYQRLFDTPLSLEEGQ